MDVAVGSGKAYKFQAATAACDLVFGDDVRIHGVSVDSGISAQPMNNVESITGARNRATAALKQFSATCEIGVGIENGLSQVGDQWYATTWIVAVDREGGEGIASSLFRPLPAPLIERVLEGQELSHAMLSIGEPYVAGTGLIEAITNGVLSRESVLVHGIVTALSHLRTLGTMP